MTGLVNDTVICNKKRWSVVQQRVKTVKLMNDFFLFDILLIYKMRLFRGHYRVLFLLNLSTLQAVRSIKSSKRRKSNIHINLQN